MHLLYTATVLTPKDIDRFDALTEAIKPPQSLLSAVLLGSAPSHKMNSSCRRTTFPRVHIPTYKNVFLGFVSIKAAPFETAAVLPSFLFPPAVALAPDRTQQKNVPIAPAASAAAAAKTLAPAPNGKTPTPLPVRPRVEPTEVCVCS